jgi:hypothetical protein
MIGCALIGIMQVILVKRPDEVDRGWGWLWGWWGLEEFAVGVAAEEEGEPGEVGLESVDVVGGVADVADQGCVEVVVVAGEPGVEELEVR